VTVRFGATIVQVVPYQVLRDDFLFVESIGLDNGWVIDQFWIDGDPEVPLLEAWTTLAAVAADTSRIRIGAMVTNVANRNPGILAKSVLTVDQVSEGRVDVAVGGGFYPVEHEALGIDFLDAVGRGDSQKRPSDPVRPKTPGRRYGSLLKPQDRSASPPDTPTQLFRSVSTRRGSRPPFQHSGHGWSDSTRSALRKVETQEVSADAISPAGPTNPFSRPWTQPQIS
jgi:hypothetical protein